MSNNSLASLLAWMKDEPRMLEWGLIVAFERRKANLLMAQEYIRRFDTADYLPPVSGNVEISNEGVVIYDLLRNYELDIPRLAFAGANMSNSRAKLTMSLVNGTRIRIRKETDVWAPSSVSEVDPLQGPKLWLDLQLDEVSGDVDKDGRVKLDLSRSEKFGSSIGQTDHDKEMNANLFKAEFTKLPDRQRVYPLGTIGRGPTELMSPKSFELRTQPSGKAALDPESPEYGDGAILALIRTMGRNGGNYPGEAYRYLIPDDPAGDYSATVLFDRRRVPAAVLMAEMAKLIRSNNFDYVYEDGEVTKAIAKSGWVRVPPLEFTYSVGNLKINTTIGATPFPANSKYPFVVDVSGGGLSVSFNSTAWVAFSSGIEGIVPIGWGGYMPVGFKAEYELVTEENRILLRQTKFELDSSALSITPEGGGLSEPGIPGWDEIIGQLYGALMTYILEKGLLPLFQQSFKTTIIGDVEVTSFLKEAIKLNFGQAILGDEIYAPRDIGFFGRINPTQTSFVITQMEPIIKQGDTLRFTTEPAVAGLKWRVDNLSSRTADLGTIDSDSGLYKAPSAVAIEGRFIRLRVVATAESGYFSSALVTVVKYDLTVNPLIQICDIGTTVELAAGMVGEGQLSWSIKNPVPGESGTVLPSTVEGGDHTYHRGPTDPKKTYVLDEIEVTNTETKATRSVHVLALQKRPMLQVKVERVDLAKGQVQLRAMYDGGPEDVEWHLVMGGPGAINETGLYTANPAVVERFVLIIARLQEGSRVYEGHMILPLPLIQFPDVLEMISQ